MEVVTQVSLSSVFGMNPESLHQLPLIALVAAVCRFGLGTFPKLNPMFSTVRGWKASPPKKVLHDFALLKLTSMIQKQTQLAGHLWLPLHCAVVRRLAQLFRATLFSFWASLAPTLKGGFWSA